MSLFSRAAPSGNDVIRQLGLLRRLRYIHRGFRRRFASNRTEHGMIPSIWSAGRVASRSCHQSDAVLRICGPAVSPGGTAGPLHSSGERGHREITIVSVCRCFPTAASLQPEAAALVTGPSRQIIGTILDFRVYIDGQTTDPRKPVQLDAT